MADKGRFEGRRAVVTGGASGIGFAVSARLAAEGARVAIWDVSAEAGAEAQKRIWAGRLGLRGGHCGSGCRRSHGEATKEELGGVDHPCRERRYHRAERDDLGVSGRRLAPGHRHQPQWRSSTATAPSCRRMLAGGYGRIVNIASIAGKEGNPNASAYSASKAAVIGLTKSLGKELAKTTSPSTA